MNQRGRAKAKEKEKERIKVKLKEKEKTREAKTVQDVTTVEATTWPVIARNPKARAKVKVLGRREEIRLEDRKAVVKAPGCPLCIAKTCISLVNVRTELVPHPILVKTRSNS